MKSVNDRLSTIISNSIYPDDSVNISDKRSIIYGLVWSQVVNVVEVNLSVNRLFL